jgi:IMP dehydrogenase
MKLKQALELARQQFLALTYDDVKLRTAYSNVFPDQCDVSSKFSRNVTLKIPIVSSAMDSVTEARMAIEMAKLGGIGVIHRNLTPEKQAEHVATVKRHLNGLIPNPVCIYENETVQQVLDAKKEKGYDFDSFPVLDKDSKLVGIVTGTDFDFCDNNHQRINQIMSRDLWTAPKNTSFDEAYRMMQREKRKILPLLDKNGKLAGLYIFRDIKRIVTRSDETYNVDSNGNLRVAAAIGVGKSGIERAERLVHESVDALVIDAAHADTKSVIETLKYLKRNFSGTDIVVGNISIGESAKRLARAGADGIKIGQGPGSICTTRVVAGVGRPQVSAVYDCAMALGKYAPPLCADGGLKYSGEIPIAFAAGASCVMMGSLLAGTDESPGKIIFFEGRQWKDYRGMGSMSAMEASKSSRERYLQPERTKSNLVPEGIEGMVPYVGSLASVMVQHVGGLKSGMGYTGCRTIKDLNDKAELDRMTPAGNAESHPHDIRITKDAPNYPR